MISRQKQPNREGPNKQKAKPNILRPIKNFTHTSPHNTNRNHPPPNAQSKTRIVNGRHLAILESRAMYYFDAKFK
jgi:hypothetical protein